MKTNYLEFDVRSKLAFILLANLTLFLGRHAQALKGGLWLAFLAVLFGLMGHKKKARNHLLFYVGLTFLANLATVLDTDQFFVQRIAVFSWSLLKLYPGIMAGSLLLVTTSVSQLFQGLEQLRIPRQFILPFIVMLRFIPHFITEFKSVTKMLRLRRTSMPFTVRFRPSLYLLPMLNTAIRSADDLAKASYARGLSIENKRSYYRVNRFTFRDGILLLVALTILLF